MSFEIRKTTKKGWGLFATEEISAKQFIIEYVGEVIGKKEFDYRFEAIKDKNYYFCTLSQDKYIDSKIYGSECRFANHPCEPNAVLNKWVVFLNGQKHIRVGLFALRQIHSVGYF